MDEKLPYLNRFVAGIRWGSGTSRAPMALSYAGLHQKWVEIQTT